MTSLSVWIVTVSRPKRYKGPPCKAMLLARKRRRQPSDDDSRDEDWTMQSHHKASNGSSCLYFLPLSILCI